MVTLQDMAVAYLNNIGEEIKRYEGVVAQHQSHLNSLQEHFAECQEKLAEDTSDKLKMIGKPPVVKTSDSEAVTFNPPQDGEEPSINDQYK